MYGCQFLLIDKIYAMTSDFKISPATFQVTLIHLEDRPRPGVSDVIAELLNRAKLRVMMLTGDHESSALRVAKAVGISEVHCSLKPEDKLNHVKRIARDMGALFLYCSKSIIYA